MQGSSCESSHVWKALISLGAKPMQQLALPPRAGDKRKVLLHGDSVRTLVSPLFTCPTCRVTLQHTQRIW
jgi:hypothetical protein